MLSEICTATSDSGSDIKGMGCKLLTSHWDCCVSHLAHCSLVEAFGTNVDVRKGINPEFRTLLKKVKSVIEHIHKRGPKIRCKFEGVQFDRVGSWLKLIQDLPHRWFSTIKLLPRFLELFSVIKDQYFLTENR